MAELKEARVPDIGDYNDVPVIEVLVAVGDTVAKDQGLVTLESDKATMEVPAPFAGVVSELKVKVGDSCPKARGRADRSRRRRAAAEARRRAGACGDSRQSPPPKPAPRSNRSPPPPQPDKIAQREIAQDGRSDASRAPQALDSRPGADPEACRRARRRSRSTPTRCCRDKVPYASPAVRLFARELGVDLAQVKGSERGGRIGKEDVQKFVKSALAGRRCAGRGAAPAAAAA